MNIVRKISNWYFSGKALPYWGLLILDCCIVAFSGYVGYYLVMSDTMLIWEGTVSLRISGQ